MGLQLFEDAQALWLWGLMQLWSGSFKVLKHNAAGLQGGSGLKIEGSRFPAGEPNKGIVYMLQSDLFYTLPPQTDSICEVRAWLHTRATMVLSVSMGSWILRLPLILRELGSLKHVCCGFAAALAGCPAQHGEMGAASRSTLNRIDDWSELGILPRP